MTMTKMPIEDVRDHIVALIDLSQSHIDEIEAKIDSEICLHPRSPFSFLTTCFLRLERITWFAPLCRYKQLLLKFDRQEYGYLIKFFNNEANYYLNLYLGQVRIRQGKSGVAMMYSISYTQAVDMIRTLSSV